MAETVPVEKIGFDVPVQEVYPSFVERYFTPRYVRDVHAKGDDICVLFHSNRVSLITLAPSHPVLTKDLKIVKVDYKASESEQDQVHKKKKRRNESTNRLENHMSGKRKRGAQILHRMSLLCKIELEDGSIYAVRSGIPGLLIEINEQLIKRPNLIREKPSSDGYIAIMLHKKPEYDKLLARLMTLEQYQNPAEEGNPEKIKEDASKLELGEDSTQNPVKVEQNGNAAGAEVKMEECSSEKIQEDALNMELSEDSTQDPVKVEQNGNAAGTEVKMEEEQDS